MIIHVFHQVTGKGIISFVARFVDGKMGVEHATCKSHIAHKVQQLMSRRLVGKVRIGSVQHTVVHLEIIDILVESSPQTLQLLGFQRSKGSISCKKTNVRQGAMLAEYSSKQFISAS